MRSKRHRFGHSAWLLAAALAVGCSGNEERSAPKELVVFAAASLRDAFTALGPDFERAHPGARVTFNFAGTQRLRAQLEHGAPADVFASADPQHMDALLRAGRVERPVFFAQNEPVIVVAEGAPRRDLGELPSASRLVVGTPEVPIGRYTGLILDRAALRFGSDFRVRVEARVVSRELNVRQVLAKVSLGEADAGIVYRTDVRRERVRIVDIPAELNVVARYPIAALRAAPHPELARAWIAWVRSDAGQATLARFGFGPAPREEHPG